MARDGRISTEKTQVVPLENNLGCDPNWASLTNKHLSLVSPHWYAVEDRLVMSLRDIDLTTSIVPGPSSDMYIGEQLPILARRGPEFYGFFWLGGTFVNEAGAYDRTSDLRLARACPDGGIADQAPIQLIRNPAAMNNWIIDHFDALWDGSRFAVIWRTQHVTLDTEEAYIMFGLFDAEGNAVVPPARFPATAVDTGLKLAFNGSMYAAAWIDVLAGPGGSGRLYYVIQRFDLDGNPVGCMLNVEPRKEDFGAGEIRMIPSTVSEAWLVANGDEWVGSFETMSATAPGYLPNYGSLWRFELGLPAE